MNSIENVILRLQNGNDVRGAAIATDREPLTLTPGIVALICAAFAQFVAELNHKPAENLRIGLGHDSRLTAESLKSACLHGLSFVQAFDCGLITTPAMFQSTVLDESSFDAAIMITASHLPVNRNGLKFFTKGSSIDHDQLRNILNRAVEIARKYGDLDDEQILLANRLPVGKIAPKSFDLKNAYCNHMCNIIKNTVKADDFEHPLAGLHIIEDAGNGASGFFATQILAPLGADVSGSVFLEPDGTFPNHIPNPENADAMQSACRATLAAKADLGVIFDCDGDRGAVVFSDGTEVNRNTLIALLAHIVAESAPHSTVVTDSVTSDELADYLIHNIKLDHLRYKRGYKNVIDKGVELNEHGEHCELAIETSGHGAFRENYFSDDGAYIALKIICKMAQLRREGRKIEELIADLKQPAEAREVRFDINLNDFHPYGLRVLDDFLAFVKTQPDFSIVKPNFEGIRVRVDGEVQGWFLLRMSLHDPAMPMNLESRQIGGVDQILARIMPFFAQYDKLSIHK